MAQTDPVRDGKRRLLDVCLQMQHYEKWKEDLALAADLGINAIRYSVPCIRRASPRWLRLVVDRSARRASRQQTQNHSTAVPQKG